MNPNDIILTAIQDQNHNPTPWVFTPTDHGVKIVRTRRYPPGTFIRFSNAQLASMHPIELSQEVQQLRNSERTLK